jgi:hypothetical protein
VLAAGALSLLLGLCAYLALPSAPPARFTRVKFDRIQKGMTRADVEALLGHPGDYTTGPVVGSWSVHVVLDAPPDPYKGLVSLRVPIPATVLGLSWEDDGGWITVGFDASGKAVVKTFGDYRRDNPGPLGWLRWLWQRLFP